MFLVRLGKGADVDHVVCIDLHRRLIFDNQVEFPLALTDRSLRLCAGGSRKSRIGEVR